jgi:hypothetical protein
MLLYRETEIAEIVQSEGAIIHVRSPILWSSILLFFSSEYHVQ